MSSISSHVSRGRARSSRGRFPLESGPYLRPGSLPRSEQRYLGLPESKHFRYHSIDPDTGSFESARDSSNSPPRHDTPKRRTQSIHNPRELVRSRSPQSRSRSPHVVLNPSYRRASSVTSGSRISSGLCVKCLDLNVEKLGVQGGYKHSLLSEMRITSLTCKLCEMICRQISINSHMSGWTADRYRIVIALDHDLVEEGDSASTFSASSARRRKSFQFEDSDHTMAIDATGTLSQRPFSRLWVAVMDLCPWEPPEDYKARWAYDQNPNRYRCPVGSAPKSVRGRPLYCLTDEHDSARGYGVRWVRDVGSNTASPASFEIAAGWLAQCLEQGDVEKKDGWMSFKNINIPPVESEHAWTSEQVASEAKLVRSATSPARLVEVMGSETTPGSPRLIETKGQTFQYAALSYCWGKRMPNQSTAWQTTEATINDHLKEICIESLPATLSDAILIAQRLDIPYIWIDSLCIMQDSLSDWSREAAKMSEIYLESILTIAACSGVSVDEGCFNIGSESFIGTQESNKHIEVKGTLENGECSRLYVFADETVDPDTFSDEILKGRLAARAWTFQEFILPRRTLYYTNKQLFWECHHCRLSEDNFPQEQGKRPYPIVDYSFALGPDAMTEQWYMGIVEQYSRRQLTFKRDKLVAISALAEATYHNRHVDYVAGLWKDSIISGLMWRRDLVGYKSTRSCPSWSWASQDSAVSYEFAGQRRAMPEIAVKVLDVQWTPDPSNRFADVLSAHIDLSTAITLGTVLRDNFLRYERFEYGWEHTQAVLFSGPGRAGLVRLRGTMDNTGFTGGRVAVALLGLHYADLVFLLLDPPDLQATEYRRVGLATYERDILNDSSILGDRWVQKTIRLV